MYFDRFPTIKYGENEITNITLRFGLVSAIKDNVNVYSVYRVRDGEKPEDIAYNLYGDVSFHWLVLVMNDMVDILNDWVKTAEELNDYLDIKYTNPDDVHHYINTDGYIVPVGTVGAIPITNREYEERINESRREIKLLKPEFLSQVIEEFETEINNG